FPLLAPSLPPHHINRRPAGYLFFFSSRRRHTRSKRDWSSDVCSSDLLMLTTHHVAGVEHQVVLGADASRGRWRDIRTRNGGLTRSEERRVGKEGRSSCCAYD